METIVIIAILAIISLAIYTAFKRNIESDDSTTNRNNTQVTNVSTNVSNMNFSDIITNILYNVDKHGHVLLGSSSNQHELNKVGWTLNSYNGNEKYNPDDKYIIKVSFYDEKRRGGDVKSIDITINPTPGAWKDQCIYKSRKFIDIELKGLQHHNIDNSDIGRFIGYAQIEPENSFDNYAVAIYNSSGKKLGYIPKHNYAIFNCIKANNGQQSAWGIIQKSNDEYIGNVIIPLNYSQKRIDKEIESFKNQDITTKPTIY